MLKITRQNVNDRIAARERNVLGNRCSDLLTGMLHLRFVTHLSSAPALGPNLGQRMGIKRQAHCPAPTPSSTDRHRWHAPTMAVTGARSAG